MAKKPYILCIILLSLPIGIITYQLIQPDQNHSENLLTNVETTQTLVEHAGLPKTDQAERTVKFHSKINKKMLTYHKGFFSLTPHFNISINGKEIKSGQTLEIPITDNTAYVTYAYDFMGHKKGKKRITFEIPAQTANLDLSFSWKEEPRVFLGNAKAIEVKEIN